MLIRKLISEDLHSVSSICLDAFMTSVAPSLQEDGIRTFQSVASMRSLANRMEEDNKMFVCEDNTRVIGYLELKEGRHITMLFVSPSSQKKGVGKLLISAMLPYAKTGMVTVSASLTSVTAYLRYGFECIGETSESAGLMYQPMEMKLKSV